MTQQGRPFPYTKSRNNKQITALRDDGPCTSDELPNDSRFTPKARQFIGKVAAPWSDGEPVWYLWGDERRAVRRFIDLNEANVREALGKTNSTLATRMEEPMWRLLCEEWLWSGKMTDDEIEKHRRRERREEEDDDG